MFAYCGNDPVTNEDPNGNIAAAAYGDKRDTLSLPVNDVLGAGCLLAVVGAIYLSTSNSKGQTGSLAEHVTVKGASQEDAYSVYFLYETGGDPSSIVYVGRVKTKNFDARMSYHFGMGRSLAGAIHGLDYATCRAFEQAGMMFHHTINSSNSLNNQIRGISPSNKKLYDYLAAAFDVINTDRLPGFSLLPTSYWANFAENEFLNLGS